MASAVFNVPQQSGASLDTALLDTVAAGATAGYLAAHGRSAAAVLRGDHPGRRRPDRADGDQRAAARGNL